MLTYTLNQSISVDGRIRSGSAQVEAGSATSLSEAVPDASTNLAVGFSLDVSETKLLYVSATVDMTVTFLDGDTDPSIALLAGVPFVWHSGGYTALTDTLPLDVTGIQVTNASGDDGVLNVEALFDPTP